MSKKPLIRSISSILFWGVQSGHRYVHVDGSTYEGESGSSKSAGIAAAWAHLQNEHAIFMDGYLVGGLVAILYFPINIGFLIIPIDEL